MASSVDPFTFREDEIDLFIHVDSIVVVFMLDWFQAACWWKLAIRNLIGLVIIVRIIWWVLGCLLDGLYSGNVRVCKRWIRTKAVEEIIRYLWDRLKSNLYTLHLWSFQSLMIEHQPWGLREYRGIRWSLIAN